MESPWAIIEGGTRGAATALTWRRLLGPAFEAVAAVCLRETGRTVKRVSCEKRCKCSHVVRKRGATLVGVCDCLEGCDDMPLTAAEVKEMEVDLAKLGRAIAWGFECEPVESLLEIRNTIQVADFAPFNVPVCLSLTQSRDDFQQVISKLVALSEFPFILFGFTNRFMDERCMQLLERRRAQFVDIASETILQPDGKLVAKKRARELFARYLPIPGDKTPARGPVVAVRGLKAEARNAFVKAGSHWDVTFDGGKPFHLPHTHGAGYLNYLFHNPSETISAYDLEMKIRPDEAQARTKGSIQNHLGWETIRACSPPA